MFFETSIDFQRTTRSYIPEDRTLFMLFYENDENISSLNRLRTGFRKLTLCVKLPVHDTTQVAHMRRQIPAYNSYAEHFKLQH